MSAGMREILKRLKAGLAAVYGARLKGVYLFGSYARGEEDAESDLDVLIVLDRLGRYGAEIARTSELIADLSAECGVSISRVFASEADWVGQKTSFYANVKEEAVPV